MRSWMRTGFSRRSIGPACRRPISPAICGLAPSAVSRMLKGERQMKLLEAVQIAAFLGVSQEEVLRHAGAAADAPRAHRAAAPRSAAPPAWRRGRPPDPARALAPPARGDTIPIRSAAPRRRRTGDVSRRRSDRLHAAASQSRRGARRLRDLHGRRQHGAALRAGLAVARQPVQAADPRPRRRRLQDGRGRADQAVRALGRRRAGAAPAQPAERIAHSARRGPSNATSSSASTRRADRRAGDLRAAAVRREALSSPERRATIARNQPDPPEEPPTCAPALPSTT